MILGVAEHEPLLVEPAERVALLVAENSQPSGAIREVPLHEGMKTFLQKEQFRVAHQLHIEELMEDILQCELVLTGVAEP